MRRRRGEQQPPAGSGPELPPTGPARAAASPGRHRPTCHRLRREEERDREQEQQRRGGGACSVHSRMHSMHEGSMGQLLITSSPYDGTTVLYE
jgi:hypothetical protein